MARAASSVELAELQSLRAQLQALEQQIRDLSRRIETKEQATAATRDRTPPASAPEPSFTIQASTETHRLRIRANSQVDARFVVHGDQGFNDTFLIRRLPVSIEAQLGEKFFCRLMPDFAPSNVVLLESYVRYQQSAAFNLLLGKTKSPFDLERLVAQTDLLFLERAHPSSLAPNRDIGVQVFGDLVGGTLTYQLAWLNGARDNDSTITDVDDEKEVVARLMAYPFRNGASNLPLRGLGFGLAVSRGEKTAGNPNGFRTSVPQTFFTWRPSVVNEGRHTRIEPQAYLYAGPVGIIGSWVASRQSLSPGPGGAPRDLTTTAWYAAANVVVTGEDASYRGVTPLTTFSPANGTWGALEIAARYSALHVDDDAFPFFATVASASRARTSTLGFNWYLSSNIKASLNFEHTDFSGGAASVSREDEDALLSRVQVRY
jgi:phosphate-selective porin OprO/OprP